MSTTLARTGSGQALSIEADRAARVLMRKSPETLRTYLGIYTRFAAWLAERDQVAEASVSAFTAEAFVSYLDEREQLAAAFDRQEGARCPA